MAFKMDHLHFKSPDPKATTQFYVDCLGATIVREEPNGYFLDLHGVPMRVSGYVERQKLEQFHGLEHLAIDTDDMPGTVEQLKANGGRILEERVAGDGRKICFFEGPQGVRLEVLEWKK